MRSTAVTARAVDAAAGVARANGVRCDQPHVIDDRLNVIVRLRPAPVVAPVSTTTSSAGRNDDWLRRELAVAGFLADSGAPVVGPSAELPPGPHCHDGLWLTFWELVDHERGHEPPLERGARMLYDLHAALADFDGELPLLEPVLGELPRVIVGLEPPDGGSPRLLSRRDPPPGARPPHRGPRAPDSHLVLSRRRARPDPRRDRAEARLRFPREREG